MPVLEVCSLYKSTVLKSKETTEHYHAAEPRMMGSTEHNMGRVAHNAFVFSWIIEQIEKLNNSQMHLISSFIVAQTG